MYQVGLICRTEIKAHIINTDYRIFSFPEKNAPKNVASSDVVVLGRDEKEI